MDKWTIAKRNTGGLDNRLSLIRPDWKSHKNLSQANWVVKVLALRSEGYSVQKIEEILTSGRIEDEVIRNRWALGEDMDPQWGDDRDRAKSILWNSRILALGSEGYSLKRIQEILTSGRIEDQMIRDKWDLGDGNEPKWDKDIKARAKDIFWGFGKVTIQLLYQGSGSPADKGMRVEHISEKIKADSGFYYAPTPIIENLTTWGVDMRGRSGKPSVAKRVAKAATTSTMSKSKSIGSARPSQIPHPMVSPSFSRQPTSIQASSMPHRQDQSIKGEATSPRGMADIGYRKAAATPSHMKIVAPVKGHALGPAGQYGCAQPGYPLQTSINHPAGISPSTAELYYMIKDQKALYDSMMSEAVNQAKDIDGIRTMLRDERFARQNAEKAFSDLQYVVFELRTQLADGETKNVALSEKVKTLAHKVDQLQLKNNQLVAENAALQRDCMMATNALDQIIRKLKTMSLVSQSEQSQALELMNECLSHLSICEQSRKVNIDSGYFEDPVYRQFLNFLPYGLQIPARTSGIAHPAPTTEDERQRKRYCISAPTPASIDGDEGGHSPQLTNAGSETGTKSSASGVDDIEMHVAQDLIEESSFANADGLVQFQNSGEIVFGAGSEHDGSLEGGDIFEMFMNLDEMADESTRGMI